MNINLKTERYEVLQEVLKTNVSLVGTITRYSNEIKGYVVLLKDIEITDKNNNKYYIDHLWINNYDLWKLKYPHGTKIKSKGRFYERIKFIDNKQYKDIRFDMFKFKIKENNDK